METCVPTSPGAPEWWPGGRPQAREPQAGHGLREDPLWLELGMLEWYLEQPEFAHLLPGGGCPGAPQKAGRKNGGDWGVLGLNWGMVPPCNI